MKKRANYAGAGISAVTPTDPARPARYVVCDRVVTL